jgi:hypothetical protein
VNRPRVTALAACVTFVAGCHTTTLRSGLPAASAPTLEYDERWHSGLIAGIAELSGPYSLAAACPHGWAEIKTETSFLNGLVQALTWSIYNPQSVTVVCAASPAMPGQDVVGPAPAIPPELPPPPQPPPGAPAAPVAPVAAPPAATPAAAGGPPAAYYAPEPDSAPR